MSTTAEKARAESNKKGLSPRRAKKLSARKPKRTSRVGERTPDAQTRRQKRDSGLVIAEEQAFTQPAAVAIRGEQKSRRVRASR
jgi:hypothetical protein